MRLFVIIPGFGAPHIPEKVHILQQNLARIRASKEFTTIRIRICVYDPHVATQIPKELWEDPQCEWILRPGVFGEFLHRYATPKDVEEFDYVLFLLDDVELMSTVSLDEIVRHDQHLHMDIYSPTMTSDSKIQFSYMCTKTDGSIPSKTLFVTSACEAFCYFMSRGSYEKYYAILRPEENPWLWGIDTCLYKYYGLRSCLLNHMQMRHHYKNESYAPTIKDKDPFIGRQRMFDRLGTTLEALAEQKAVLYYIMPT